MSFNTLPRATGLRKYIPGNMFVGRAEDGRIVDYACFGADADLDGLKGAFSVDDCTDTFLWQFELSRMVLDCISAIEGRDIPALTFWNLSGGSLGNLLGIMECKLCPKVVI